MNNNLNALEQLSRSHEKTLFITQKVKKLFAQEECTQNEIEKIIETLAYDYIYNL